MTDPAAEEVDVLIVGAGFSGLGIAHHLRRGHPGRTWAVLDARAEVGGTWDLFRYPGVRSDSDLYTFGYSFRPWRGDSIASGESIRDYLDAVADDGLREQIRFRHVVRTATWCSAEGRWSVEADDLATGLRRRLRCRWLVSAAGYFDHDRPHEPTLPGREEFEAAGGVVVHPQRWTDEVAYADRRVVIIGSGATAVTMAPVVARTAREVVVLQRSPGYVISAPSVDVIAVALQRVLPADLAHRLIRWKNMRLQRLTWRFLRRFPGAGRRLLLRLARTRLPDGYPIDEHFSPAYDPWDERLCAAPDGDFFTAIADGSVRMVTDTIERLDATGIQLGSGEHLDADVVVTATGLEVRVLGGIELVVDGDPVDVSETVTYRGMMLSGVPNLTYVFGYLYSSWTLKVDLVATQLEVLLGHLDATGTTRCTPVLDDPAMARHPMLDMRSGYVLRSRDRLPQQGDRFPWLTRTQYDDDRRLVLREPLLDPRLEFAGTPVRDHPARGGSAPR